MIDISTYTKYLPPVLWSPQSDPTQFLGRTLRIFEHILAGIPPEPETILAEANIVNAEQNQIEVNSIDEANQFHTGDWLTIIGTTERVWVKSISGTKIVLSKSLKTSHSTGKLCLSTDNSLARRIDKIPQLFNPWRAPPEFLPWLASWLALEFEPDWSEYQQRKFIAEILSIYQQRGLKQGLLTYLDIYATTKEKPRIAIDDGEALLRADLKADSTIKLNTVAHSRVVGNVAVLLHPTAIAVDRDNNYIIADQGGEVENQDQWQGSLWKMNSSGEIAYQSSNSLPVPQPIYSGDEIENPTAVVIDEQNRYYLLCIGEITSSRSVRSAIYSFSDANSPGSITTVIDRSTTPALSAINPVDMLLDISDTASRFIVLDRGSHRGSSATKLVVVNQDPLIVEEHNLTSVVEPTAIIADLTPGQFIIADAKEPPRSNSPFSAADLLRVDPNNDWSVTSLLGDLDLEQNPLIFPTGLVWEHAQSLLVCDTGVRISSVGDSSNRHRAEPAAIYRVDISSTPPTITQITNHRKLVHPSKIAIDRQGYLLVADRGSAYPIDNLEREWRARPNEFGVVVLFSQQRATSIEQRNKIRFDIANVINEQKAGHTFWWMRSR